MMRTWKTVGLTAFLAATLTGRPCLAQSTDHVPEPQTLDEVRQQVEQMRNDTIHSFQAAKKDIETMKEEIARLKGTAKEIETLRDEIAQLRKSLDEASRTKPLQTRSSAYPPTGAATATGTIRLTNTYPSPVTIIVNGASYNLTPGESRILASQPAGMFSYEVVGVQPAVERTLISGATYPILVHP